MRSLPIFVCQYFLILSPVNGYYTLPQNIQEGIICPYSHTNCDSIHGEFLPCEIEGHQCILII